MLNEGGVNAWDGRVHNPHIPDRLDKTQQLSVASLLLLYVAARTCGRHYVGYVQMGTNALAPSPSSNTFAFVPIALCQ